MARGRRPEWAGLVGRLDGSGLAKARLEMLLEVLAGRRSIADGCARLGLSERRLHALRQQALQAALASLEPRPAGRPVRMPEEGPETAETLQATIRDLRLDLRAAQVREEIALTMPDLLRETGRGSGAARQAMRGPRGAGTSDGRDGCEGSARSASTRARRGAARPASARSENGSGVSVPGPWPTTAGPPATGSP
jgi:Helix-turn-helix domain